MKTIEASLSHLNKVVDYLNDTLPEHCILFLTGDLAAGKTTLVKQIISSKGAEVEATSPTFSLQHQYSDELYHYDLYRKELDDIVSLGLIEEFEKDGWHMVEWGSGELKTMLMDCGYECYDVIISPSNQNNSREYKIGKVYA